MRLSASPEIAVTISLSAVTTSNKQYLIDRLLDRFFHRERRH